ncbi:MAG TPA: hypothetical protein VJ696_02510 [Rhodanobacteraceae bacterium]|nr:hypothetical protein [Rhodanobacteraceae bacterium]
MPAAVPARLASCAWQWLAIGEMRLRAQRELISAGRPCGRRRRGKERLKGIGRSQTLSIATRDRLYRESSSDPVLLR